MNSENFTFELSNLFKILMNEPNNDRLVQISLLNLNEVDLEIFKELLNLEEVYPNTTKEELLDIFKKSGNVLGFKEGLIVFKQGVCFKYYNSYMSMEYRNKFLGDCYLGDYDNLTEAIKYCMGIAGIDNHLETEDIAILNKVSGDLYEEIS